MIGKKVSKSGMVVDRKTGATLGRLVEGKLKRVVNKKVGENGEIKNDKGRVIGRVEPIPQDRSDDDDDDDDEEEDNDNEQEQESTKKDNDADQTEANDNADEDNTAADKPENEESAEEENKEDDNNDEESMDEKPIDNKDKTKAAPKNTAKDAKNKSKQTAEDVKDEADKAEETDAPADDAIENVDDNEDNENEVHSQSNFEEDEIEDSNEEDDDDNESTDEEAKDSDKDNEYIKNKTDDAAKVAKKGAKSAKNTVEQVKDEANNNKEDAEEGAEDDAEQIDGKTNEAGDNANDIKEDAEEQAEDASDEATNKAKNAKKETVEDVDDNDQKQNEVEGNEEGEDDNEEEEEEEEEEGEEEGDNDESEEEEEDEEDEEEDEGEDGEEDDDNEEKDNPYGTVDEDSPEVRKSGKVVDSEDNVLGTVDKKVAPKLAGLKVDKDGNVYNKEGHIVAKANLYENEKKPFNPNDTVSEESPEVRKSGKVFDMDDELVGYVDKKMAPKWAGFKVDPEGNVINHEGEIVGSADMIKPKEEDDDKEEKNPYPNDAVNENSPEVRKSGKVFDMDDELVGHVDKRMAATWAGFKVDEEGNVYDNDGHIVGRAKMVEPEQSKEKKKPFNPNTMVDEHSPTVRKSGKIIDENDNVVGHVDKTAARRFAGFPVDDDGNIINEEGQTVGKAKMENQKSEEQLKEERQEEEQRKIVDQLTNCIQQSLDKIQPILKQITDHIDDEESKSKDDRDEQKLVDTVKPLIEQGSSILEECNGAIRGLDPSGKIAREAQAKSSSRKATPEEHHLAELLAKLSGDVSQTIDRAKKKIRNMPHAKKELNPLWNILQSPLLQILSAVGLLLSGVLGLVGNILNGLGLGSIINNLLGGIGLNKILEGFGLGDALNGLLGKKKK
ncbi:hypothetical protein BDF20DRAFT_968158 [Mycotypha africana]|uniref:uncharacterized protein n=1 Tax=Mycotypha africana TaxID=64632 RepID=UPI0023004CD9|nr:uncharacterized protein BDF20DRAFT_968158 [Mycotypha africana]KAI8991831.1 hypothetical protein BDF20DRAFT_968158 [Mycotypha africana]